MNRKQHSATSNQNWVVKPAPSEFFTYRGRGSREMNWGAIDPGSYLVSNQHFYVHNRCPPPQIDTATWQLQISGNALLKPSQVFSYEELLSLPPVSMIRAMVCGADGRSFFPKLPPNDESGEWKRPIAGSEWRFGAIGVAEWTGVRLSDLLNLVGLKKDSAKSVLFQSVDQIQYSHVIPIDKALADDTLLVYRMNGEVLPIDHGYPVRAFFSGWGANSCVKWLGGIEVSDQPIDIDNLPKWQQSQVLRGPNYPEPQIITVQNVKSAFELDWDAKLAVGTNVLRGRAWSGSGSIAKVEVKIEQMDTKHKWQPIWDPAWRFAGFVAGGPNLPLSWVRWEIEWDAQEGYYQLMARATDEAGNCQPAPEDVPWNEYGLLYNGHVGHPVVVVPD